MPKKVTTDDFIKRASIIHKRKFDYSKTNYTNNRTKVCIICPVHGEFYQLPDNHLYGYGCFKCGKILMVKKQSSNNKHFIKKSKNIHGNMYDYSKVKYITAHKKVEIICKKHGSFFQKPNNHLNGRGCSMCIRHISKSEIEFLNHLKIPDTLENRQKYINPYKVDGIKGNKIFEFLGDYYHGNPLIYDMNKYNPTCHKTFGELYKDLCEKFNKLNDIGYSIYYMWENDWKSWIKNKSQSFPIKKFNIIK